MGEREKRVVKEFPEILLIIKYSSQLRDLPAQFLLFLLMFIHSIHSCNKFSSNLFEHMNKKGRNIVTNGSRHFCGPNHPPLFMHTKNKQRSVKFNRILTCSGCVDPELVEIMEGFMQ
ncbi:hypothetical protein ABZP36_028229 [Zizania latifolia]